MDTTPWNYWEADRKAPIGRSAETVRLIEAVLVRSPNHVQAAHLYIHLLEASDPARAEAATDRLSRASVPSAAHLIHMPGHIYYVRGRYAERQNKIAFEAELAAMATLSRSDRMTDLIAQGIPISNLLRLADAVARGRFAVASGHYAEAATYFQAAIAREARLPYQEPPYWYYPVRQSLGAALFLAGRYAKASEAFKQALIQTPHNGWSLYGLARSEAAQGKGLEAAAARKAFLKAWQGEVGWLRMERI